MELFEYGELLSVLIPRGGGYVTMDKKYICVFHDKPYLEQINDKSFKWTGAPLMGWIRYWPGFIDMDYITDPVDGKIDWHLACEKINPNPWKEPKGLQMWAECFDRILPYDSRYATVDGTKIEFWSKIPVLNELKGKWEGSGGRYPVCSFSYPREKLLTKDGSRFDYYIFSS